jgi:multicomponent Na+:H+ antiporter subunit G
MEAFVTVLAGVLILIGSLFTLASAVGVLRLPDLYSRMHAASKAGTVGSGLMLIALALHADDFAAVTRAIAGVIFFILTAPISAHLLAKAAYAVGYPMWEGSVADEMQQAGHAAHEDAN